MVTSHPTYRVRSSRVAEGELEKGGFVFIPFLASIAYGAGIVIDKIALSKRKIPLKYYIPYVFLWLFFFSALATPFFGQVDLLYLFNAHQDPWPLFLLIIMILLAITWNIFYYEAFVKEDLYEFETIIMMVPMVTIMLSWVFFPEKWSLPVGIAAVVAGAALVWSHWEKHHFTLNHYSMNLLTAVVLMAMEDIVVTDLLNYQIFSPVSLYATRTLILFIFFFAYYKPDPATARRTKLGIASISGLLGAIYMILKYYGYITLGIPFTILITVMAPVAIYAASAMVMKERIRPRTLIAAAVICVAVVYATAMLQVK